MFEYIGCWYVVCFIGGFTIGMLKLVDVVVVVAGCWNVVMLLVYTGLFVVLTVFG
jgi:hypothetical protein